MNACTAIVGINWGDEGKGRMVDLLTEAFDVVIRYQGGANAGHTVINQFGEFEIHALPSGVTVRFLALPERTLTLPASVTTIEAEAFAGLGEGCVLAIPASVTSIADNAFSGTGIRVIAPAGSYAAQWAGEHGIACQEP